jgi:hypothetical protein
VSDGALARLRSILLRLWQLNDAYALTLTRKAHPTDALVDVFAQPDRRDEEPVGGAHEDSPPVAYAEAVETGLTLQGLDVQVRLAGREPKLAEGAWQLRKRSGDLRRWGTPKRAR